MGLQQIFKIVTWPFRKRRWLWILILILVLPMAYIRAFDEEQVPVDLLFEVPKESYEIFVVDYGYHTAIVIEQPPEAKLGPPGNESARYLEYGWGDKAFFYDSNFYPHSLFASGFLPSTSVMYLRGHERHPADALRHLKVYRSEVSSDVMKRLIARIEGSFQRSSSGERSGLLPPTEEYAGSFYLAKGSYIWWSNCNRWTIEVLADAGLDVRPEFVITSGQAAGRLSATGTFVSGNR